MSRAVPNPSRPQTLIELSTCDNCSRIIKRVVQVDGVIPDDRSWEHQGSGGEVCDPADVRDRARRIRGRA